MPKILRLLSSLKFHKRFTWNSYILSYFLHLYQDLYISSNVPRCFQIMMFLKFTRNHWYVHGTLLNVLSRVLLAALCLQPTSQPTNANNTSTTRCTKIQGIKLWGESQDVFVAGWESVKGIVDSLSLLIV